MSNCRCKKSSCVKIVSDTVANMPHGCFDVCTNPICGSPDTLSLMAPLIYDEIGVNLCATFNPGVTIATAYPTATSATASVVDIEYTVGADNVRVTNISGRPNCYDVTLANLTVTLAVNFYDSNCVLLGTEYPEVAYLPAATAPTYDEDTNPSSITLEMFAPYGTAYTVPATGDPTATVNYIGFGSDNNGLAQGINMFAYAKLVNLDREGSTVSVGLTLIVQSMYYAGYRVETKGKIRTPKGSITGNDDTSCMKFVDGELLNLAIKPLELGFPAHQECLKNDCEVPCNGGCNQSTGYGEIPCTNGVIPCTNGVIPEGMLGAAREDN